MFIPIGSRVGPRSRIVPEHWCEHAVHRTFTSVRIAKQSRKKARCGCSKAFFKTSSIANARFPLRSISPYRASSTFSSVAYSGWRTLRKRSNGSGNSFLSWSLLYSSASMSPTAANAHRQSVFWKGMVTFRLSGASSASYGSILTN